ncbi:hypothetical protein AB0C12_22730 [Actinoplanes sp. NPDC048967]|uniref:hypothetical protein n=1 Tax=Actinoplanes sp. NPDC048967 TaxID=3155269 RepID=UPI0033F3C441
MRTARTTPLLLVLSFVVTLGGCAGGPAPRAWAASVCTVLAPWRSEIGTLATRTQQQMTAETTPAQAKENLTRLFGGAESASEKARAGVRKAGVPDVEQGKEVADSFTASLSAMRDAYGRAKSGIAALATSPSKDFYTKVGSVVETLNVEYKQSELDTSRLDSAELKKAFDEAPECR